MSTASQLTEQPILPPAGPAEPDSCHVRFQAEVNKLKDQFTALDNEVRKGGKLVVCGIAQMIPALAEMEPFLSRKGEHHDPQYVKMLVAAGLPTGKSTRSRLRPTSRFQ